MNMVLLGLPGAGKGTQGKMINKEFGLTHIATGDIFRNAIKNETPLGKEAKKYIDAGELVPDDVTVGIIKERLTDDDCEKGFVLDGFPRTLSQAKSLTELLEEMNKKIDMAIYIEVAEDELVIRLSGRRVCEECGASYHVKFNSPAKEGICDECGGKLIQRSDDEEETVKNRIRVNNKQMIKLVNYYKDKGVLEKFTGTGKMPADVSGEIKEVLKEYLK